MGYQAITFNPDGTIKSVVQSDATAAKGQRSYRQIKDARGVAITSIQENFDATEVPKTYLDNKLADKIANGPTAKTTADYNGQAKVKGTKDPNTLPKDPNTLPKDPNTLPVDPNAPATP